MGTLILDILPPRNEGPQDSITHVPNHVRLKGCRRTAPTHNTRAVTVGRSSVGLQDCKQTVPNVVASGAGKLLQSCLCVGKVGFCAICILLHCGGTDGNCTHLLEEQLGYEGLCQWRT